MLVTTSNRIDLQDFEAWSGAIDTKETIIKFDKETEFESLIDDLYPDGIDETTLNDLLWFEEEWIYRAIGIEVDEDGNPIEESDDDDEEEEEE